MNKYATRADGMHYRTAFGREIDVVNLDEGVPGVIRFKSGQETECIGFKTMCREFTWYIAMKEPYQGGSDYVGPGKPILIDAVLDGEEWNDMAVYTAVGSYNAHSRERFKR